MQSGQVQRSPYCAPTGAGCLHHHYPPTSNR